MLHGSCLCGDIAFDIAAELMQWSACHCTICRKLHGTAYGAYATARKSEFQFTRGESRAARYRSSERVVRWFCAQCGSTLPEPHQSDDAVDIPIGALQHVGPELQLSAHIFVSSRAPWYEIPDSSPRFDAWPPPHQQPVLATPARASSAEIAGSCLCNTVGYVLEQPPRLMHNCHCSRCRRARAAPHATNAFTTATSFHYTRGKSELRSYKLHDAQYYTVVFCRQCGAPMPHVDAARDKALIPAGSFDSDPGVRPSRHIFVASKAPWFEIADTLPQYAVRPD
jgi:hypothetical protein